MIYPDSFEQKIGFSQLRQLVAARCESQMGSDCANEMTFSVDYNHIMRLLKQTAELKGIIANGVEFPLRELHDIREDLQRATVKGIYLTEQSLHRLLRTLTEAGKLAKFFRSGEGSTCENLKNLSIGIDGFPDIKLRIERILDSNGNLRIDASVELMELHQRLMSLNGSINGVMRRIITVGKEEGTIDRDATPTIRDGRLVIPVSPANRRKINGIVHDESATGKTIFIEPAEVVETNNRIRETENAIRRETIRILTEITDYLRPFISDILGLYSLLGILDFIRAKARIALDLGGSLPKIHQNPQIEWYRAEHPILKLSLSEHGKKIVPLNIELTGNQRILLISGPNAGGKSVCLKTVGIVQYMMQCGMLPPVADNSHMGIFNNIFIDIGDEQSIEDDLSTYSSHLRNMKEMLSGSTTKTLVLIDEFGSGTEPQIGGALAQAILQQFNMRGVFGVITTHYQNLKTFADETEGIVNGAMLYDRQKMLPLFQLSIGYPGSSFALEIARKTGLPQDVIDAATEIVGSDYVNMDKYLLDISRDRRYWDNKRQDIRVKDKKLAALVERYEKEIDDLRAKKREIIDKARAEASEILSKSNAAVERTIHEIKRVNAEREKTREMRRQLDEFKERILSDSNSDDSFGNSTIPRPKNKRNKKSADTNGDGLKQTPLLVGDFVTMDDSSTVGKIISLEGKKAVVTFGQLKTKVDVSRLKRSMKRTETVQSESKMYSNDESRLRQLSFSPDIDVRGMKADEAVQAVTYFIDDAIQFGISPVRILHGTGNGILRQFIREYLNSVPYVSRYRDENVQFGGAGITVVELK